MRLTEDDALSRLRSHDHGVLSTLHAERGIDAVPVVYCVADDLIGVPVDQVKAKSSSRLQRQANLEADPRATLLIEHWDRDDWSKLWWVRAELRYEATVASSATADLAFKLAGSFIQYQTKPFDDILTLRITAVSGWAA